MEPFALQVEDAGFVDSGQGTSNWTSENIEMCLKDSFAAQPAPVHHVEKLLEESVQEMLVSCIVLKQCLNMFHPA